jgi:drug/metabolite transporter (DMT)-like permease
LFVGIAMAGMSLILVGGEPGQRTGDLIALASGVFFALAIMFFRRDLVAHATAAGGAPRSPASASNLLGTILAGLVAFPFAIDHLPALLVPRGAAVVLYLGIFQVGLGYVLLNRALRHLPASAVGLITMLEPVLNPIWVFVGLGEAPGVLALGGAAIVLGTIVARTIVVER